MVKINKNIFVILALILIVGTVNAALWEDDPNNCPTSYVSQNCLGGERMCGYNGGTVYCYDMTLLNPPGSAVNSTSQHSGGFTGGYLVDCEAYDGGIPHCDNTGALWCNRDASCYTTQHRLTTCTANLWSSQGGAFSCDACRTNYHDCNGDLGDCEIHDGAACGTHAIYDGCNGAVGNCTCSSGHLDCDATGPGVGNGCEIQTSGGGEACTLYGSGLSGNCTGCGTTGYDSGNNDCACQGEPQPFVTGINAQYSTSDSLLWGSQYGTGYLINMSNGSSGETKFGVDGYGNVSTKGNIHTSNSGFFGWLGSLTSRITKLWVGEINATGDILTIGNMSGEYVSGTTGMCIGGDCRTVWPTGGGGGWWTNYTLTDIQYNGGNIRMDSGTLFVDQANNKVGMGTETPITELQVIGNFTSTNINVTGNNAYLGTTAGTGNTAQYVNAFGSQAAFSNIGQHVNALGYNSTHSNIGSHVNALGFHSARSNTASNINALGYRAAQTNIGQHVNALGSESAGSNTGSYVNALGQQTTRSNTGSYVNAIGFNTAHSNSGSYINALGFRAARSNTGSYINTLGYQSTYFNTGQYINALGYRAAFSNTGDNVNAFGYNSSGGNMGNHTNSFGYEAARSNTGSHLNALGNQSAQYNTGQHVNAFGNLAANSSIGNHTNALGYKAAFSNTGSHINALGYESANSNSGLYINALGYYSAHSNTGSHVNAFGDEAARSNSGSHLNALGQQAARSNTGTHVNAFGNLAAIANTANNVNAFGQETAHSNTGSHVNAFGLQSALSNSGDYVNALGYWAAYSNTGTNVNALGYMAARENSGNHTNAFGNQSAQFNTGQHVNAFGNLAANSSTGNNTNALGYQAAQINTGNDVNAMGEQAARYNTGQYVNAFGYWAGRGNTGAYVNGIGYGAASGNSGNYVNAIGNTAASGNSGNYVNAIGSHAGPSNSGNYVNVFGQDTANTNSGNQVIGIGDSSLHENKGDNVNAFGPYTAKFNRGNYVNTIGQYSAEQNNGSYINAFGYNTSWQNIGNNSIFLGYEAGKQNTQNNVFIVNSSISGSPTEFLIKGDLSTGNVTVGSDICTISGKCLSTIGSESDPFWSANLTAHNDSWNSRYNATYQDLTNKYLDNWTTYGGTWASNDSGTLDGYDSTFFMPLNKTFIGAFDFTKNSTLEFDGGVANNGTRIENGDIWVHNLFVYNLTSTLVSNLNVNGSMIPYLDDAFDIGSAQKRWRDLYLSHNATIDGSLVVDGNTLYVDSSTNEVGIGTSTPSHELNVIGDANITGNIYGTFIGDGSGITGLTGSSITGTVNTTQILDGTIRVQDINTNEFNATYMTVGSESDPFFSANLTAHNVSWNEKLNQIEVFTFADNGTFLKTGQITGSDILPGSINTTHIIDGTITATDLSPSSINTTHIIDGTITIADINTNEFNATYMIVGSESDPFFSANLTAHNISWNSMKNTSYVPFIGAQSNVNLGTNNITAEYVSATTGMCIAGDCRIAWPSGSTGGDWWTNYTLTDIQYSAGNIRMSSTMFVDNTNHEVGIGTETPSHELNVVGDANITGTLYVNNEQVLTGSESDPKWQANLTAHNASWSLDTDTWNTSLQMFVAVDNGTFLKTGQITGSDILPGSINETHIIANSINTTHIIDGTITAADLAPNSVNTTHIIDDTITGDDLADNVTMVIDICTSGGAICLSNVIVSGSITSTDITANSINTTHIIDGTITVADIDTNEFNATYMIVGSESDPFFSANLTAHNLSWTTTDAEIRAATLFGANLTAHNATWNEKLDQIEVFTFADNGTFLKTGQITGSDILPGSINTTHIIDGTITGDDLSPSSINTTHILDGTIRVADIDTNEFNATFLTNKYTSLSNFTDNILWTTDFNNTFDLRDKNTWNTSLQMFVAVDNGTFLKTGQITGSDILPGSINETHIIANSINTTHIIDGTITGDDLSPSSINTTHIVDGTITAVDLAPNSVNTTHIIDDTITGDDLADNVTMVIDICTSGGAICLSNVIVSGSITSTDITPSSINTTHIIDGTITIADINTNEFNATYMTVGSESDPFWSANLTAHNDSWNSRYNATYQDLTNKYLDNWTTYGGTWASNDSGTLDGYDSTFFMPLNKTFTGAFDFSKNSTLEFDGGVANNGTRIENGDIWVHNLFVYNLTSTLVSNLNVNGSMIPYLDDAFDIGSAQKRWRDLYLSHNATIDGSLVVDGNTLYVDSSTNEVGIGTSTPSHELNVIGDANITGNIYGTFIGDGSGITGLTGSSITGTVNTTQILDGTIRVQDINTNEFNATYMTVGSESDPFFSANLTAHNATWNEKLDQIEVFTFADNGTFLKSGQITGSDILPGSINTTHIINGTITSDDLAPNSVNTTHIIDGTITGDDLAPNSVNTTHIVDGTIDTIDITNNAITGALILDDTITGDDLADNVTMVTDICTASGICLSNSMWINVNGNATFTTGRVGIGTTTPSAKLEVKDPGVILIINDTNVSANNREWFQIYNKDGDKKFEIGSISNGNSEIRFGDASNTKLGFPPSDPTYFAFINDYTEMWLGNAGDDTLYFNYYNGSAEYHGTTTNRQKIEYFVGAGANGFVIDGDLSVSDNVGIGTTSPGEELYVVGDINASGEICITGGNCLSDIAKINYTHLTNFTDDILWTTEFNNTFDLRDKNTWNTSLQMFVAVDNGTFLKTGQITGSDILPGSINTTHIIDGTIRVADINTNEFNATFLTNKYTSLSNFTDDILWTTEFNTTGDSRWAGGTEIWNESGWNIYPGNLSKNVGIGTTTPIVELQVVGNFTSTNINVTRNNAYLGVTAGTSNTGNHVNAFGDRAAQSNSGTNVNALGQQAAQTNTGNYTNAFGYRTAGSNDGNNVNAFGSYAAQINDGNNVNAFGEYAAYVNDGSQLNAFGTHSAQWNDGNNVNAFGSDAAYNNSGNNVNAIGHMSAGYNEGTHVNAFGSYAAQYNIGNDHLNAIGYSTGKYNSGSYINLIGYSTAQNNTGDHLNALGYFAAGRNKGDYLNALGFEAAQFNTGEHGNVFGYQTAQYNNGSDVNAIGYKAAQNNIGNNVNAFGRYSAQNNTGNNSIFMGHGAGITNTQNNVFIVNSSISGSPTEFLIKGDLSTGNVTVGSDICTASGKCLSVSGSGMWTDVNGNATFTTGRVGIGTTTPTVELQVIGNFLSTNINVTGNNAYLGETAGASNTAQHVNAMGYQAAQSNSGTHVNALGWWAARANNANSVNALGYYAARSNTDINVNAFGYEAGETNSNNDLNAFGYRAGRANTGLNVNAIGKESGQINQGNNLNAFGERAGYDNRGISVNAIGYWSGRLNTGDYSNFIGMYAGENNTGDYINALGLESARYNSGNYVNALGELTGQYNYGSYVNALGQRSARYNNGSYVNAIGYEAAEQNKGYNILALGDYAARYNTGNASIFIGHRAGINNTDNNVFMVNSTIAGSPTTFLYGDLVNARLGIGVKSIPTKTLEVSDGTKAITFDPAATTPTINTTAGNLSITSAGGSVIITLG